MALLRVQLRDDLSPWRKTAVRNVRDNNAARVAGPGRICFCPPHVSPTVFHPPNSPAHVILSGAGTSGSEVPAESKACPELAEGDPCILIGRRVASVLLANIWSPP